MKKKVFVAIATVLALIVMYFVGSGFMKNTSAIINDYRVSADGKEITLNIGVASAVRDWAFENTPFNILYSYMKADNIASEATAKSIGMHKTDEYVDAEQELTSVYTLER